MNFGFLNFFIFYPFQINLPTVKLNSYIDTLSLLIKFIFVLNQIFIKNEYASIIILLILILFLLITCTFFMILIAKICMNSKING